MLTFADDDVDLSNRSEQFRAREYIELLQRVDDISFTDELVSIVLYVCITNKPQRQCTQKVGLTPALKKRTDPTFGDGLVAVLRRDCQNVQNLDECLDKSVHKIGRWRHCGP